MTTRTRTVLITGAARGIGAQTARVLHGRGWNVALSGIEPDLLESLAASLGEGAAAFAADVTVQSELDDAVASAVEQFGGLDAVVANAGIASFGTVRTTDPEAFARTVDVNLTGAFRTLHAALPALIERRGHALVIASVASFTPMAGLAAYAASKAGAESLASSVAQEVGHLGVTVGSAHPGWIDTDMVRDASSDLQTFNIMRKRLPWPLHKTTTLEECGEAIADGVERRLRRVYVPRATSVVYWSRALLQSKLAERVMSRMGGALVPQMEAEVESLGRSVSARVAATQPIEHSSR
jgi:NAD(P)-dependent dehydrogenase (short-subunit alcohol dehydrogenase family)